MKYSTKFFFLFFFFSFFTIHCNKLQKTVYDYQIQAISLPFQIIPIDNSNGVNVKYDFVPFSLQSTNFNIKNTLLNTNSLLFHQIDSIKLDSVFCVLDPNKKVVTKDLKNIQVYLTNYEISNSKFLVASTNEITNNNIEKKLKLEIDTLKSPVFFFSNVFGAKIEGEFTSTFNLNDTLFANIVFYISAYAKPFKKINE